MYRPCAKRASLNRIESARPMQLIERFQGAVEISEHGERPAGVDARALRDTVDEPRRRRERLA